MTKKETTNTPLACEETAKAECHGDMRKFAFLQRCSAYRQRAETGLRPFYRVGKTVTA